MLNLVQPIDVLKKAGAFFEIKCPLMLGHADDGIPEKEWIVGNARKAHLVFRSIATSKKEAKEKLKKLREIAEIRKF